MILTSDKIEVTDSMCAASNLTQFGKIGVPINPANYPAGGVVWKNMEDLRAEDFDALEEYFLAKRAKK